MDDLTPHGQPQDLSASSNVLGDVFGPHRRAEFLQTMIERSMKIVKDGRGSVAGFVVHVSCKRAGQPLDGPPLDS